MCIWKIISSHTVAKTMVHIFPNVDGIRWNWSSRSGQRWAHRLENLLFLLRWLFSRYFSGRVFHVNWERVKVTIQTFLIRVRWLPLIFMRVYVEFCSFLWPLHYVILTFFSSTSSPYIFCSLLKIFGTKQLGLKTCSPYNDLSFLCCYSFIWWALSNGSSTCFNGLNKVSMTLEPGLVWVFLSLTFTLPSSSLFLFGIGYGGFSSTYSYADLFLKFISCVQ